ncbi:MAG: class I SAM-dependent methyltransferase [Betaproteobacteria bacterium]|nr:class I SAM-dependent methyltransferase [Betaproteobacteria bacterium]MDH5210222.1 class I SAM-dependent methyltransferase [Betaproteobacteria bacterium]MDH5578414.1 class I SAM-dependent methyltransferase [Betaproteobacteria bacterium]
MEQRAAHSAAHPHETLRSAPSPKCIACGGGGVELYQGLTDYLAGTPQTWRMVRCARATCGLLWLDPQPLAADLIKAYATYHTHSRPSRSAAELGLSALNAACKLTSRLLEVGSGLGRQRRQLRTMFIGRATPGRLLEVGCGSGRFLARMRRAGWQVQGTDFDPAVARRVHRKYGLQIDVGDLAALGYPTGAYDVVALSQVIEHVHDPVALLRECSRVLRPGGRLVLSTPNAAGLAHRRYGRYWRGLEPPRHLHVFTPNALAACTRASGLRVEQLATLSAESASVYRASDAMRQAGERRKSSAAVRVVRSWILRYVEFLETQRDPDLGQDIFMAAAK